MSIRYFLILILGATFSTVAAQSDCEKNIFGQIFDVNSKEPLPFVTVQIEGTSIGTISDDEGHFLLEDICEGEIDLIISHIGYKTITHHHDDHHDSPKIYLASDDVMLESIVVEGKHVSGEFTTIGSDAISGIEYESKKTESLSDLLTNVSGVTMVSTGANAAKPVIHGLHSNRILIINNGVRHEFQNWGIEHAPEIDPSIMDRVEVLKGAATVRYGPEALGGVILVHPTKLELSTPFEAEVQTIGKTNGRSGEVNASFQKGFDKWAITASGSYLKQGDLSAPNYILSNTGMVEKSIAVGTKFHFHNFEIDAYYSRFEQELGFLRGSVTGSLEDLANAIDNEIPNPTNPFTYEIGNPGQDVTHDLIKLKGQIVRENQSLEFIYGLQINDRQEYDVRRGTLNEIPAIDLKLYSHTIDANWHHSRLGPLHGVMGVQLLYQDNNNIPGTQSLQFVPNYTTYRAGLFIIESLERDLNTLEFGLRYDWQFTSTIGRNFAQDLYESEWNFQNVTASIGYKRKLKSRESFSTNLSSAWRPPNVAELYSSGRHQSVFQYGLLRDGLQQGFLTEILTRDQKSIFSEVGFKWINTYEWSYSKFDAQASAYINYLRNFIYRQPTGVTNTIRGPFPTFNFFQDDALITGIDVSINYKHNKYFTSNLAGNYLYSRNLSRDDVFVGMPPTNLRYQIQLDKPMLGAKNTSLGLVFNYAFRQYQAPRVITIQEILEAEQNDIEIFEGDDSTFDFKGVPSDYLLVDLSLQHHIQRFNAGFQIKNLLNSSYRVYTNQFRYFSEEPGINFILSLSYNIE